MHAQVVPHAHAAAVLVRQAETAIFSSSSLACFGVKEPALRCRGARQHVELGKFSSARLSIKPRASSRQIVALQGTAVTALKWVLEPVGDGDCKHLDTKVPFPSSFELLSDSTTVGRLEGKVDIVLDVATVSGLHARLDKKGTALFVTDMGSTNGTYVNKKRIKSGTDTPVPPGSVITFGDEHLAIFKFSQVKEEVKHAEEANEEVKANGEVNDAEQANPEA